MLLLLWRNIAYRALEWTEEPITARNIFERMNRLCS